MTNTQVRADNTPNANQLEQLKKLCNEILEPLREKVGPIRVHSGFRSYEVNERIGGSGTSQHMKGQAVDFSCYQFDLVDAFRILKDSSIPYDQLILECPYGLERGWIHVSRSDKPRRQVLIYGIDRKYQPFTEALCQAMG